VRRERKGKELRPSSSPKDGGKRNSYIQRREGAWEKKGPPRKGILIIGEKFRHLCTVGIIPTLSSKGERGRIAPPRRERDTVPAHRRGKGREGEGTFLMKGKKEKRTLSLPAKREGTAIYQGKKR